MLDGGGHASLDLAKEFNDMPLYSAVRFASRSVQRRQIAIFSSTGPTVVLRTTCQKTHRRMKSMQLDFPLTMKNVSAN